MSGRYGASRYTSLHSICSKNNTLLSPDILPSPFFTMRIDSLLVLLYVTCIAISIKRKNHMGRSGDLTI